MIQGRGTENERKKVNISKSVHKTKEQTYQLELVESMVVKAMMVKESWEMRKMRVSE